MNHVFRGAVCVFAIVIYSIAAMLAMESGIGDSEQVFSSSRGNGHLNSGRAISPMYRVDFDQTQSIVKLDVAITELDISRGILRGRVGARWNEDMSRVLNYGIAEPIPATIPLQITSLSETTTLEIPVRRQEGFYAPKESDTSAVEFEMVATPRAFPLDGYAASTFMNIGSFRGWPSFSVFAGQGLSEYNIEVATGNTQEFRVLLTRKLPQTLWVFAISFAPLMIVMYVLWIARRERATLTALAGVAVGLLALLPVRQVLVPPTISSLTLVDLILGAEFLGAIILFLLLASEGRHRPAAPTSGEARSRTLGNPTSTWWAGGKRS